MKARWIVVADASRARVYATSDRARNLSLVQELDHPEGRLRDQELVSDGPGRLEKHGRGILSTMDPPTDPHEEAARHFAEQLALALDKGRLGEAFESCMLVAPAHFLGLLKASLSAQTAKRLDGAVARDLTRLPQDRMQEALREIVEQHTTGVFGN